VELAKGEQKGLVVVPDTQKALQELAVKALADYEGEVIAVTGSVGKTTCKSMVCDMLEHMISMFTRLQDYHCSCYGTSDFVVH
jgi:UDP-N-acetylmuramyl pentapeptide synthase